jgi:Uma2 family endonuclease
MPDMDTTHLDRSKEWTVEEFLLLNETNTFCELVNSELIMSPSPTPYHQFICSNLNDILKAAAKKTGAICYFSPIDLFIDSRTVYQPDLLYLSKENRRFVSVRGIEGVPDIVVEIISPTNALMDRNIKRITYQRIGVKEYWLVDPDKKTLEVYFPGSGVSDTPPKCFHEDDLVSSTVIRDLKFLLKEIF